MSLRHQRKLRRRLNQLAPGVVVGLLVMACSLPTFNPPKLGAGGTVRAVADLGAVAAVPLRPR